MKKIITATIAVAISAMAGYNTCLSHVEDGMSDMVLENVEALANDTESMTQEEYQDKYGCTAVLYYAICTAKDGKKHSYAINYE